jgi:glycerol-3-phosphate dehydrogenase (NAD(P)+)
MDVAVLGSGSWGTALAILLARNGLDVTIFGRDHEELMIMRHTRENLKYLPGFTMPKNVTVDDIANVGDAPMTVVAVPASAVRPLLADLKGEHPLLVMASKGLELTTGMIVTDVAAEMKPDSMVAVLSGPNLAVEIVQGIPTAAVAACTDPRGADRVRSAFMCPSFRVYASSDVKGVELAGALKNVLAIGGGLSDGLGFGDNTKGALLARGLKEMITYGLAMGGHIETFLGIAGVGDLFATASSKLSRNYRLGYMIGSGKHVADALHEIGQITEGLTTAEAVVHIARHHGIQIPVFETIDNVVREKIQPRGAVSLLMERFTREEGLDFGHLTHQQYGGKESEDVNDAVHEEEVIIHDDPSHDTGA